MGEKCWKRDFIFPVVLSSEILLLVQHLRSKHFKAHPPGSCSGEGPLCPLPVSWSWRARLDSPPALGSLRRATERLPKASPGLPPPRTSFRFSLSGFPPPKLTRARSHRCSLQCARAAPGASGPLLPLQWFTDNPALLSECAVDSFPPASPHLCHSGRA